MELYEEIITEILQRNKGLIDFSVVARLVDAKCYYALKKIKAIIENEALSDKECFVRIEEIISALEEIGSGGGARHDFG